jgi:uncharacterized cupin superfamily protein
MSDASTPSPRDLLVTAADRARLPERPFRHPLNPAAEIHAVELGRKTGLRRIGVSVSRVAPGHASYAAHVHHGEEECLFVLSGRGVAEVGPEALEIGPGDFVGFPPATHAHLVRNTGLDDLVYLNVGEGSSGLQEQSSLPHGFSPVARRWRITLSPAFTTFASRAS